MDQRKSYAEPRAPQVRIPKVKLLSITPIAEHKHYADAIAILRTLEAGQRQIQDAADALRIEGHLARRPDDPRAADLRARLNKHRATKPQHKPSEPSSDLPPEVVAALRLLSREGKRPVTFNRKKEIAQLEEDELVVHEAIRAQQPIVDSIRDDLIVAQARKDRAAHDALVLAQYRAAQSLSAASDALEDFRSSRLAAGYSPWCADLLPAPPLRAALILGSESAWDSEICRTRRLLEEWKIV